MSEGGIEMKETVLDAVNVHVRPGNRLQFKQRWTHGWNKVSYLTDFRPHIDLKFTI